MIVLSAKVGYCRGFSAPSTMSGVLFFVSARTGLSPGVSGSEQGSSAGGRSFRPGASVLCPFLELHEPPGMGQPDGVRRARGIAIARGSELLPAVVPVGFPEGCLVGAGSE